MVAGIFAAVTNTGNQAAWVLCHLADNQEWYGRVKKEVDDVVSRHRLNSDKEVIDTLRRLRIDEWETEFPSIDLALRESIRLNMAGVSFRLNVSNQDLEIAGSKEVIPPRFYAVCTR